MIRQLPVTALDLESQPLVWDVREPSAYAQSHLRGAHNQPLDQIDATSLAAIPAGQPLYVLCGGGTRAFKAAERIQALAPQQTVIVLTGGTRAAKAAGLTIDD